MKHDILNDNIVQSINRGINRLMWVAYYRDNKVITQYAENVPIRSVDGIPRKNLKKISLVNHTGRLICSQDYLPGQSPLYRMRTLMAVGKSIPTKIHILGWAVWEANKVSKISVAFIDDETFSVEIGHFVESGHAGFKFPIEFNQIDYIPIEWT